jgi:hypothetical protein
MSSNASASAPISPINEVRALRPYRPFPRARAKLCVHARQTKSLAHVPHPRATPAMTAPMPMASPVRDPIVTLLTKLAAIGDPSHEWASIDTAPWCRACTYGATSRQASMRCKRAPTQPPLPPSSPLPSTSAPLRSPSGPGAYRAEDTLRRPLLASTVGSAAAAASAAVAAVAGRFVNEIVFCIHDPSCVALPFAS